MDTYLLTWNPMKFYWDDYADNQLEVELGFDTTITWSCGTRKHMPIGSRVFMMRLGYQQPIHGIFASGYTVGKPYLEPHWNVDAAASTAQYVEFRPDAMLNPEIHRFLDPERDVSTQFNWRPQSSGVEIPEDVAYLLEEAWVNHLKIANITPVIGTSTRSIPLTFVEGKQSQVTVNRYERDPKARKACIDFYGTSCCVCGFDFGVVYGEIGNGFIHVHHLNPIAAQDGAYPTDPVKDLRPVCPNCHAMLHREAPPLSIEQLRKLMESEKTKYGKP